MQKVVKGQIVSQERCEVPAFSTGGLNAKLCIKMETIGHWSVTRKSIARSGPRARLMTGLPLVQSKTIADVQEKRRKGAPGAVREHNPQDTSVSFVQDEILNVSHKRAS